MHPGVRRTLIWLLCVIVVIVGAVVARIVLTTAPERTAQAPLPEGVFVKAPPRNLSAFMLTDEQGRAFDNARLKGQWSVIFLGYTHCPDICPTTLALFKQVHQARQRAGAAPFQYVLLSADPVRDTPARLASYVHYFDEDFVGVTGPVAKVNALARELDSLFARVTLEDDSDYLVDHSVNLMVVNPAGQYHALIRPPHSVEKVQAALEAIVAAYPVPT